MFDGQKVVSFYLFLRNYEEPEVIIENVLCSLSTPDSFSSSDSAETTDDAAVTDAEEQKVYTDKETVQKVQEALNQAGFNCGTPDGVAEITDELLAALGIAD